MRISHIFSTLQYEVFYIIVCAFLVRHFFKLSPSSNSNQVGLEINSLILATWLTGHASPPVKIVKFLIQLNRLFKSTKVGVLFPTTLFLRSHQKRFQLSTLNICSHPHIIIRKFQKMQSKISKAGILKFSANKPIHNI